MEVTNRFKGFDFIEYLKNFRWRFVTLYRRQGARTSPREKKNTKKQNDCLRRLYKSCEKKTSERQMRKGKIYHQNSKFQRIGRRDKKAFLTDQ